MAGVADILYEALPDLAPVGFKARANVGGEVCSCYVILEGAGVAHETAVDVDGVVYDASPPLGIYIGGHLSRLLDRRTWIGGVVVAVVEAGWRRRWEVGCCKDLNRDAKASVTLVSASSRRGVSEWRVGRSHRISIEAARPETHLAIAILCVDA